MIRKLTVEGVTVFPERESFSFVPGVNIIVGGNDCGKSHLMKLCFAVCKWSHGGATRDLPDTWAEEKRLRKDLLRVFGTSELTAVTSRSVKDCTAAVKASLEGEKAPLCTADVEFTFHAGREEDGLKIATLPDRFLHENAVFIPPREILSIYPCYMQAGKRYPELLDSASWELCRALESEPQEQPAGAIHQAIRLVERMLSGHLMRINGHFYLHRHAQEPLELNLIAEGFKRIGTLGLLLGNGTVHAGTTLFWDEPEMNINATHLPLLVNIMMALGRAGVQLILTTHSLFLLRELTIQLAAPENRGVSRRFTGLQLQARGREGVRVSAGESMNDLEYIDSLDAEMEQADRYLAMHLEDTEEEG